MDPVKEMVKRYQKDTDTLIPLELDHVNITHFASRDILNSKDFLVIPISEFFNVFAKFISDEYNMVLEEISNPDKQMSIEEILSLFETSKEMYPIFSEILKNVFIELEKVAKKSNRELFISIENTFELFHYIKSGWVYIFANLFNFAKNIHLYGTKNLVAVELLIKDKKICDQTERANYTHEMIIDSEFLNSMVIGLEKAKFHEILRVFKSHRLVILKELFGNDSDFDFNVLSQEFLAWYKKNLYSPSEYLKLIGKAEEIEFLIKLKNSNMDLSKSTLENLELTLIEINESKKYYQEKIDKIVYGEPETYPDWIEPVIGKESFIQFLKERNVQFDHTLFESEEDQNNTKEIKHTKKRLKDKLIQIDGKFKETIIGQEHIVQPITSIIKRWFIGIRTHKPIGSLLFVGPTGVGKTETAKFLNSELFDNLITLDMSEYQTSIDVSKIIGIAPGYVGYEEGGGLLEKVAQNPKSIILFDEMEKAHPKVYDLLLQLLDEGRLTDNKGNAVSFKECLIIVTTNANIEAIQEWEETTKREITKKEMVDIFCKIGTFRREFLARFDNILRFNKLSTGTLEKIFYQKLDYELNHFLNLNDLSRELTIEIEEKEKEILKNVVLTGLDSSLGAREIQRTIQERISNRILDELVNAELYGSEEEAFNFQIIWDQKSKEVKIKSKSN